MTGAEALVPAAGSVRGAALVLPGGGYAIHAEHQAEPLARWLAGVGLDAHVLRYRVGVGAWPAALAEARDLLRRVHDERPGLPVGVVGTSAGGHLAAALCTATEPQVGDGAQVRPDFAVLAFPVVSFEDEPHGTSTRNVLGDRPSAEDRARVSVDRWVDASTPPTFVWTTADDAVVSPSHALRYARALVDAGVPVELHVFPHGRHGLGVTEDDPLVGTWTALCERWLEGIVGPHED